MCIFCVCAPCMLVSVFAVHILYFADIRCLCLTFINDQIFFSWNFLYKIKANDTPLTCTLINLIRTHFRQNFMPKYIFWFLRERASSVRVSMGTYLKRSWKCELLSLSAFKYIAYSICCFLGWWNCVLVCSNALFHFLPFSIFSPKKTTHTHIGARAPILNLLVSWLRHYAHPFGVYDRHFTRKRHFFTRICIWDRIISNIALHTDTRVHIFHLLNIWKKNSDRQQLTRTYNHIHAGWDGSIRRTSHFKQQPREKTV